MYSIVHSTYSSVVVILLASTRCCGGVVESAMISCDFINHYRKFSRYDCCDKIMHDYKTKKAQPYINMCCLCLLHTKIYKK